LGEVTGKSQQAAGKIVDSGELAQLLLNSTGEGIYGIDLEGNCTFANPACAKLLGFESVDDLLGQRIHDLVHHTRANGEPYPVTECRIYKAFHQGEGTHVDDEVMFCANGKSFHAEYWSYPIHHGDELIGCVVTFIDITDRKQHEELQAQFARIPDINPGPVVRIDGDGTIRLANIMARKVFGDDIVGCSWPDRLSGLEQSDWKDVLDSKKPVRIECEIDGRYYTFAHCRDFEGDLVYVFGTDITAQKLAEADLRIYSQIVTTSTDFVTLINRDYVYEVANQSYRDLLGKTQEEIVGHNMAEVIGEERFTTIAKLNIDKALAGESANYQSQLEVHDGSVRYLDLRCDPFRDTEGDVIGVLVDGRDITEEKEAQDALREADDLIRLLLNSTGEGIYGIDLNGNCTFANPACAKLLGFESVDDLLGKQMHKLIHHTRSNGKPYPVEECQIYKAFRQGKGTHVDDEIMFCANGNPFQAEYWSYPMFRKEELVGCVVTFVDITERRRVEDELRQTEKMAALGKLSAGLAHELNNPAAAASRAANQLGEEIDELQAATIKLAGAGTTSDQWKLLTDSLDDMRQYVKEGTKLSPLEANDREEELMDWLETRDIEPAWMIAPVLVSFGAELQVLEAVAEKFAGDMLSLAFVWLCRAITVSDQCRTVESSSASISELVNTVKSYSHMDRAPSLDVDIHQGIEDTLRILHHKLKNGVEVVKDFDRSLPHVTAQGSELNQVWTNLFDNAVSAMDGKGKLTIKTYLDDGTATVLVNDDGPGIPEEIQHRIFEPFFTTKEVGDGTGLGLDVVNRIVTNRCGGRIDLESEPGNTTFRVRIPVDLKCEATESET
jgi:PAS domain S-box-containing protein